MVLCTSIACPVLAGDGFSTSSIRSQSLDKELTSIFAKDDEASKRLWWLRVYGGGFSIGFIDAAAIGDSAKRRDRSESRINQFRQFACQFWPASSDSARYVRAFESGYREAVSLAQKRKVKYCMGGEVFRSESAKQVSIAVCKHARRIGISQRLALGVSDRAFGDIHEPHPNLMGVLEPAADAESI